MLYKKLFAIFIQNRKCCELTFMFKTINILNTAYIFNSSLNVI